MDFLHLLGYSAVATATGFLKFINFVSVGYGFAMAFQATASLVTHRSKLKGASLLHGVGLLLYGIRLAAFLQGRSTNKTYQDALDPKHKKADVPIGTKVMVWTSCSLLYVLMFTPCNLAFKQATAAKSAIVGLPLLYAGLLMEAVADAQKSNFKDKHPDRFCDTGLYRLSRHPNYAGELFFWSGNYVATALAQQTLLERGAATLGLAAICGIMAQSTSAQEKKQQNRYNSSAEYKAYVSKTPVLFPFVPLGLIKEDASNGTTSTPAGNAVQE